MEKVTKEVCDVIEQAGNELVPCPHCQDSPKQRFLSAQRYKVEIKVTAMHPDGSSNPVSVGTYMIQGNMSVEDVNELQRPNVPASGHSIPTDEW